MLTCTYSRARARDRRRFDFLPPARIFALLLVATAAPELPALGDHDSAPVDTVLRSRLDSPGEIDALQFQSVRDPGDGEKFISLPPTSSAFLDEVPAEREGNRYRVSALVRLDDQRVILDVEFHHDLDRDGWRLSIGDGRFRRAVSKPAILLLARRPRLKPVVEIVVLPNDGPASRALLHHYGLVPRDLSAGFHGLDLDWPRRGSADRRTAMRRFLNEFDRIKKLDWVTTRRRGSTGIGYTLEDLLGVAENNRPTGDIFGIEVKSHRGSDFSQSSTRRLNLFLKEPRWTDGLSHRERIPKYGYVDGNGRLAFYSTVTSRENTHRLALMVDRPGRTVQFLYKGKPVAHWAFDILQQRLREKLSETAFVGAKTRGRGATEEFRYDTVLFCRQPSVESFVKLIQERNVVVEMRMHLRESGSARNHGTAFRIRQNHVPRLFAVTIQCRSPAEANTVRTDDE